MQEHAAVRAGDENETLALLTRLARQAAGRRYPPPVGHTAWTSDAVLDLVGETLWTALEDWSVPALEK